MCSRDAQVELVVPPLVGQLRRRLVDVDRRAVERTGDAGEAHRHPRPGEHPRLLEHPGRRPVVVVRVEPDPVLASDDRLARPVAPGNAVRAVGSRRRDAAVLRGERRLLRVPVDGERGGREIRAAGRQVQGDLEAVVLERLGLIVRERRVRIDVRRAPDALPVRDGAARRVMVLELLERQRGADRLGMVVTGHHHDGLLAAREVPEARERQPVDAHLRDQVREQALLLVGLRDVHLVEVDPVQARIGAQSSRRGTGRSSGPARSRRARHGPRSGCPGASRRPSSRGRRRTRRPGRPRSRRCAA